MPPCPVWISPALAIPLLFLHGSAVRFKNGAGCFLGVSGMGKSTLASSFARLGFPVLNDDISVIRRAGRKHFLRPARSSNLVPLKALYLLRRSRRRSVRIEPVKGEERLMALTRNTLHLPVQTPEFLRKNFELTKEVLRKVPVKRLFYPSGLSHLPKVCAAVLRDLS